MLMTIVMTILFAIVAALIVAALVMARRERDRFLENEDDWGAR